MDPKTTKEDTLKAPTQSIVFNTDSLPWTTEAEAANEMRARRLDRETWMIARAPQGDGWVLMTFKYALEQQQRRDRESIQVAKSTPQKYWHIKVDTSADISKEGQIAQPVMVNGELLVLYLNSAAIVSDQFLEALNNSVRPNMQPRTNRKDGDTFEIIGWKGRINFSVLKEATKAEYDEYSSRNKDRFERFQLERSREGQQTSQG